MKRRVLTPTQLNVLTALVVTAVTLVVDASPAMADPASGSGSKSDWYDLVDTSGRSIDKYTLSLDSGSAWNPTDSKHIMAPVVETAWSFYLQNMRLLIIIFHVILTSGWLDILIAPIRGLASGVQVVVTTLGLYPLMCTLLGISVAMALFRGQTSRGFTNLGVGVLIAALSIGVLAHPADKILAEGGLITQAQSASTEVNNEFFPGETADSMTSQLVNTLIRAPHQIINYGQPVDGTDCQKVYNDTLGTDDAWEKVGDCNADMKEAAQQASGQMLARLGVFLGPLVLGFDLFSGGMIGLLMYAAVRAAYSGLSMTWHMPLGIASGAGRRSLFMAAASLLASLAALVALQVFVTAWMKLTNVTLGSKIDIPAEVRFPLAGIFLIMGPVAALISYHRAKKNAKRSAEALAEATGSRAGEPLNIGRKVNQASNLARNAIEIGSFIGSRSKHTPAPAANPAPITVPSTVSKPSTASAPTSLPPARPEAPALPAGPTGPNPSSGGSGAKVPAPAGSRQPKPRAGKPAELSAGPSTSSTPTNTKPDSKKRARALKVALTAGEIGLAAATGGTSAAVSAGARAAATGALSAGISHTLGAGKTKTPPAQLPAQHTPTVPAAPRVPSGPTPSTPSVSTPRPAPSSPTPSRPRPQADNQARADQLRHRLASQSRPVHMDRNRGTITDRDTGLIYRSMRVKGQEFLVPRKQS